MTPLPGVFEKDRDFILSVLQEHLPSDTEVFFFGSRVDGTHRTASDLDILIKGNGLIDLETLALIRDTFETSDLPYKVDLLDDRTLSGAMRKNIARTALHVRKFQQKD